MSHGFLGISMHRIAPFSLLIVPDEVNFLAVAWCIYGMSGLLY